MRCADFRIGIYHSMDRGQGIGTWATEVTRDFAFEELKLHRLELDVYSFNPRAEKAYLKAGFKREGVLKDAIMDGDTYADDILMAILEDEWKAIKKIQGQIPACRGAKNPPQSQGRARPFSPPGSANCEKWLKRGRKWVTIEGRKIWRGAFS